MKQDVKINYEQNILLSVFNRISTKHVYNNTYDVSITNITRPKTRPLR